MSNAQLDLHYASVLLDRGLDTPLDYACSETISIGMRVLVPVRTSLSKGTVIAVSKHSPIENIRNIHLILTKEALIKEELFELAKWVSRYYCTPLRKVLKMMLPSPIRKDTKGKEQLFVKLALSSKIAAQHCRTLRKKYPAQANVLEKLLKTSKGMLLTDLLEKIGCSRAPIETLARKTWISVENVPIERNPLEKWTFFPTRPKVLTAEQKITLSHILVSIESRAFQTHLIHGVTGSGKTEIYLQAIREARLKKRGVVFLVPEIALTSQTIERLKSRFTENIGILHHRLSKGERYDQWHAVFRGEISIVIGARSAIFCPVKQLGLIIIDEEHESSYKQTEEQPCYHARDVAIMRGKLAKATVILGSATPSIETYENSKRGKYQLNTLTKRATNAALPPVSLIDMKKEYAHRGGFTLFSQALLDALGKRFEKGEQSLLFLNRRGYHTFQLCTQCEKGITCPHCAISLTSHEKNRLLLCHLCGFKIIPPPIQCPYCHSRAALCYKGFGTERIERALRAIFPNMRTLRMDSDTTRHKGSYDLLLKSFRSGKADVLIGTQMIAKGLHFPAVTFVGVLDSDGALNFPDFRAGEWVFQRLVQVAGRAGRGNLKGEVIIQTRLNDHTILTLATQKDYRAFFEQEIKSREMLGYPPYSRLAKITFSGIGEQEVFSFAEKIRRALISTLPPSYSVFPLIPSGYAKIKDMFRFRLLLKGAHSQILAHAVRDTLNHHPTRLIRTLVDIDPVSTFA